MMTLQRKEDLAELKKTKKFILMRMNSQGCIFNKFYLIYNLDYIFTDFSKDKYYI